ncbi:MAG TPA: trigger factor, partial [Elusimicrobiota bacterium]|nr:trigger factor [Elusimicrobiota bacterium]
MALWTATEKVTAKKLKEEGCTHVFQVDVPAPKVQEAVQNAIVRLQLSAKIPGFRPGKAPIERIKQQYSGQARAQAIEDLVRDAVPQVLKEMKLNPVAMPSVGAVKLEGASPLSFELHVEVAPQFEPKGYKGLALSRKSYAPADADVEARMTQLQEGNARLEVVEGAPLAKEHYAVIDYQILRDGKALPGAAGKQELVDLSSDQTVQGLQEGLLGLKAGETKEFPVEIGGKPAVCRATLTEIKRKVLPKVDEEFAKDLGFESVDALKAKLKEILSAEGT